MAGMLQRSCHLSRNSAAKVGSAGTGSAHEKKASASSLGHLGFSVPWGICALLDQSSYIEGKNSAITLSHSTDENHMQTHRAASELLTTQASSQLEGLFSWVGASAS